MKSEELFKAATVEVRRVMKTKGFSAKGLDFYRRGADSNVSIVSLQKSAKSTATETVVAVNYGVRSARIGRLLHEDEGATSDLAAAHWRRRLSEDGIEKWLTISASDSPANVQALLLHAIESILPDLDSHASDEALRDTWLAGKSPGLVNMKRLLFAAILVHEIGPADKLANVVGELRRSVAGGVHERLVELELQTAGVRVP